MVCLGLEPGAAIWKEQMNPLSYGGTPLFNGNILSWIRSFALFKTSLFQSLGIEPWRLR